MAQLVTRDQVKARVWTARAMPLPSGLSGPNGEAIIDEYVSGATAQILRRLKLTSPPGLGLLRDALDESCLELVQLRLERSFFGLDGPAMDANRRKEESVLADLVQTQEDEMTTTVSAKVVGGTGLAGGD